MSPNEVLNSNANVEARLRQPNDLKKENAEKTIEKPFKREIVWKNVLVYVFGHALAIFGLYLIFTEATLIQFLAGFVIGYCQIVFGIQIGAHRYYTHKSFKASKTLQVIMLAIQTSASQNCMWVWVRDHRQHHKYAETDADPHNSNKGFFFSHVGWLLTRKHPEVIAKGKGIDMSDLDADPLVMFQKEHYTILWFLLALGFPTMVMKSLGVITWMCIPACGFIIVFTLNITWLVNSWAHLYGTKPFDKDGAGVEASIAPYLGGEGYHNYHHTFPWDYKASEFGAPWNMASRLIRLFARWGHTWDLRQIDEELIYTRAEKTGDGSPYLTKDKINLSRASR